MSWFKKDPLQIITFQSYGTASQFYARGRALEDESIDLEDQHVWHLIINTWKRFETDEIKRVNLNVTLPNQNKIKVTTDNNGYFIAKAEFENLEHYTDAEGWLPFELSYNETSLKRTIQRENKFPGELLIPSREAEYGVVSDIDDTILHTGVVSILKWKVIYNSIFKHAKNRIPLEGSADFYHRLHRGSCGTNANPIFYVSHSPWNLYRYLELFLRQNNFPKGPILLRSLSNFIRKKTHDGKPQKQIEILNILKTYPNLPFILIGDSGERDPDIYMEIAEEFPKRIRAIYLRNVTNRKKMARVRGLFNNYKTTTVLLVDSSAQAIQHARAHGFIA